MVKIRLKRAGKKKAPFYHIVVADSRTARDGKVIEKIGTYNPLLVPSEIVLDLEKVNDWMKKGAQPTIAVKSLIEIANGKKKFVPKAKKEEVKTEEVKDLNTEEAKEIKEEENNVSEATEENKEETV